MEREGTFPTQPGPSLLRQLEIELQLAYRRSRRKKLKHKHIARGRVHGLAIAVAIIRSPYAPDAKRVLRDLEKEHKKERKAA